MSINQRISLSAALAYLFAFFGKAASINIAYRFASPSTFIVTSVHKYSRYLVPIALAHLLTIFGNTAVVNNIIKLSITAAVASLNGRTLTMKIDAMIFHLIKRALSCAKARDYKQRRLQYGCLQTLKWQLF